MNVPLNQPPKYLSPLIIGFSKRSSTVLSSTTMGRLRHKTYISGRNHAKNDNWIIQDHIKVRKFRGHKPGQQ